MNSNTKKSLRQILVRVKVNRKQLLRSRSMVGKEYDAFSDAICDLYRLLDQVSIADLEGI